MYVPTTHLGWQATYTCLVLCKVCITGVCVYVHVYVRVHVCVSEYAWASERVCYKSNGGRQILP